MTRRRLMSEIPSSEIQEWKAYYELQREEQVDKALTHKVIAGAAEQRGKARQHG